MKLAHWMLPQVPVEVWFSCGYSWTAMAFFQCLEYSAGIHSNPSQIGFMQLYTPFLTMTHWTVTDYVRTLLPVVSGHVLEYTDIMIPRPCHVPGSSKLQGESL